MRDCGKEAVIQGDEQNSLELANPLVPSPFVPINVGPALALCRVSRGAVQATRHGASASPTKKMAC